MFLPLKSTIKDEVSVQNLFRKSLHVSFLYSLMPLFVACGSLKKAPASYEGPRFSSQAVSEPITLELKTERDRVTETKYYSESHIQNFDAGQIVKDRVEGVEFTVRNTYTWGMAREGTIAFQSTTIEKDGLIPLNDLAFPELKQEINFILTPQGDVLKAGEYPETSVFYIPPIPLPGEKVEIGDTWVFEKQWIGMGNGIPLEIKAVGILKDVLDCEGKTCALIEISGHVGVLADELVAARFKSELQGYILFLIDKGEVLWSRIQSKEWLHLEGSSSQVASCLNSVLVAPKEWSLGLEEEYYRCEP